MSPIAPRGGTAPRSGAAGVGREDGDTLVEVLIAMVIIALTVSALLGAMITAISTSGEHRSLSVEDTILRSYAETAKYQIQFQSSPAPLFKECAQPSDYPVSMTTPSGYSVSISGIQYWNGSTFDSSCGSSDMTGVQLLTVTSTGPGASQTLNLVVRNPNDVPTE